MFTDNGCQIYNRNGEMIATANLENNMYRLNLCEPDEPFVATAVSSDIWHRRFGHMNFKDLSLMKDVVQDMEIKGKVETTKTCNVCCEGK